MIILKTESQLKSFIKRTEKDIAEMYQNTLSGHGEFDWDDHEILSIDVIVIEGKKIIRQSHVSISYGTYEKIYNRVIALYLPRGKGQGSQP